MQALYGGIEIRMGIIDLEHVEGVEKMAIMLAAAVILPAFHIHPALIRRAVYV